MRFMGIDYGTKKVGIALSDEGGTLAFPHSVLPNNAELTRKIAELCVAESVGAVVVGESHDFGGRENDVMKAIRPFADVLKKVINLPIYFQEEMGSSHEATRFQKKHGTIDSSAAAIILQRYLEKNRDPKQN